MQKPKPKKKDEENSQEIGLNQSLENVDFEPSSPLKQRSSRQGGTPDMDLNGGKP